MAEDRVQRRLVAVLARIFSTASGRRGKDARPQHGLQFLQRHIRRLRNLVHQEVGMGFDPARTPVHALGFGWNNSALVPRTYPTDRAGYAGT